MKTFDCYIEDTILIRAENKEQAIEKFIEFIRDEIDNLEIEAEDIIQQ